MFYNIVLFSWNIKNILQNIKIDIIEKIKN